MSLADSAVAEVSQFNGIWLSGNTQTDPTKLTLDHGLAGQNVQYFSDSVMKRFGHSAVFSPNASISTMVNWLFEYGTPAMPQNYLAWFAVGVGVQIADLSNANPASTIQTVIPQTTAASAFLMPFGARLYCAFNDANGLGMAPGQVYGFGVGADPLFAATITAVPTFFEPGGTFTTPGPKLFGYLIQTRNGYITRPGPAPGDVFTGVSYTSAGGAIEMTINTTWPSYALNVAPIMSTTANPAQFFIVPNPFAGMSPFTPVNRSGPTVMLIETTDQLLTSTGIDATPYLTQLSQTVSGTAPLQPSMIFPYSQRVGYICLDSAGIPVCYVSDSSNPQSINAANNAIYLPGNLSQVLAYGLRGVLYMEGPHWTYASSDSGGQPVTWAQPQLVDAAIGSLGNKCVALNSSQNYVWNADEGGLYLFTGGSFPERAVSYYQHADWARINFAAPNAVQVVDDRANQRVHVLAPLDGASTPTGILTWDYSLGPTPEEVKYAGVSTLAGYNPGSMAMVQNNATKHLEKWVASSNTAEPIGRENNGSEPNPYRDFGAAIDAMYQTALMPTGMAGRLIMHHGARLRIRGSGTVTLTGYGLDGFPATATFTIPSQFTVPPGSTLTTAPGAEVLQRFYAMSEYLSMQIECAGLDDWFQLAKIDEFYVPAFMQR
jgi:hypothetical protein